MMEKYMGINSVGKVKRKELEEVNEDFSEFSLFTPAGKIRRLDAGLPPIVEEEDANQPMRYEQVIPENVNLNGVGKQFEMTDIEDLPPSVPENEEKAIVLFKPVNTPLSYSSSNFSIDPNLIASFKNQALRGVNLIADEHDEKDEDLTDRDGREANACRAVIPWAPSPQLTLKSEVPDPQTEVFDAMDAEEQEATTMEIEDAVAPDVGQQTSDYYRLSRLTEGLPSQWQQPHCMFPQPFQNTTTPLVWYR